jgi:hypothetical protein
LTAGTVTLEACTVTLEGAMGNAERQRRYRERKRDADADGPLGELVEEPAPVLPVVLPALDHYVAMAALGARIVGEGKHETPIALERRIQRATEYARWRYQSVLDGVTVAL